MKARPVTLTTTVAAIVLFLTGCSSMQISDFQGSKPPLRLEQYFEGRTWAWGVFEDRFGKLRRQFTVEIDGQWDGRQLRLDEYFEYRDGETDRRIWLITPDGEDRYIGEADDIIGNAEGRLAGNALQWQYEMLLPVDDSTWKVKFDDRMYLQPGGVLVNRAYVSRWGVEIGTVSIFFSKQDPNS